MIRPLCLFAAALGPSILTAGAQTVTIPATTLSNRSTNDTAVGSLFVEKSPLSSVVGYRLKQWSFFDNDSPGLSLVPILFERTAPTTYVIRGIGTARASTGAGVQANLTFGLVSGSDVVQNANYFLGWKDGTNGASNTGVIDFDTVGSPGVDWLSGGHTSFAAGDSKPLNQALARTYSLNGIFAQLNEPPSVTTQPEDKTVIEGSNVSFTITATGDGNLTFQWKKGVDDIPQATAATLSLTNVQTGDAGAYRCVVTGGFGTATSNPATLTVIPPPVVATGGLVINEFVAENKGGFQDEDGDSPDWIEIRNTNPVAVSLTGWRLTDESANLSKWTFPATMMLPGGYLVVFASDKDRAVAGAELHTNFKLTPDGEYLALVKPDGAIAQEFAPAFPKLPDNTSYGIGILYQETGFVTSGASVKWRVPADDSLSLTWKERLFDDTSWTSGPTALGFDTIGTPAGPPVETAGNPVISRPIYDTASGSIFSMESAGFTQTGTVTDWSLYSTVARQITPLILHRGISGTLSVKGIGATRTSTAAAAVQSYPFGLVSGSAAVGPGDFLGWKDGGNGTNGTGTPAWTDGATVTVRWFGQVTSFSIGQDLGAGQTFGRAYSLSATVKGSLANSVATSLQSAMLNVNPSVYVRASFTLDAVPPMDALTLRVKHDDGFIAYLNGTKVAERNPPPAVAWNAAAPSDRSRDDAVAWDEFDLTAHIGLLQTGPNVLAVQGFNSAANSGDFLLLPELKGSKITAQPNRFMLTLTPGADNAPGYDGFVADTRLVPRRGIYSSPQSVTITTTTPDAIIRYTTDGSEPTETTGTLYTGPAPVNATTTLRAIAFKEGMVSTNIDTHTYLFPSQVSAQTNTPAGFDPSWTDYEVDPNVSVTEAQLTSLPSVSLVTARSNLFGANGIYTNSGSRGDFWERAASIEFMVPGDNTTGEQGFQVDCGLKIAGDSSRGHAFTPKHHFLVSFKSAFGPSKLHFPLFPDTSENDFDILELRACSTDSWPVQNGYVHQGEIRWETRRATYLRDQVMRDTMRDLGQPTSHGRYVHLYVDGLYWGLYNLCERLGDGWASEHLGGSKDDYDVIKDYAEVEDGSLTAWNQLMAEVASLPANDTAANTMYQRVMGNNPDGSRNTALPILLDAANLIDYMAAHIYAGAEDWPNHNYWSSRRRDDQSAGWRFHAWDQEISDISLTRTLCIFGPRFEEVNGANSPAIVYDRLRRSPQFRARFQRRLEALMFGGGPLTASACAARWNKRQAEIDQAIVAESARWGDVRKEPPYTRNDWLTEMTWQQAFWTQNHPLAISRFQRVSLYPGDADNDGLPDTWETRRGLNPASNDAALDSDGDGVPNISEFLSDTAPLDASSRFTASVSIEADTATLTFTAAEGRSYAIQRSPDMGSWTTLTTLPAAPAERAIEYHPPAAPGSHFFYRVLTPAP
ncbi:MAG TPA: CotH kinase family protein [Verrucomicrobiales bacterium]|nr:CotH kinase family protein [Verrucomicrobiales bacterium]